MFCQYYRNDRFIVISDRLLEIYHQTRNESNASKSKNKKDGSTILAEESKSEDEEGHISSFRIRFI